MLVGVVVFGSDFTDLRGVVGAREVLRILEGGGECSSLGKGESDDEGEGELGRGRVRGDERVAVAAPAATLAAFRVDMAGILLSLETKRRGGFVSIEHDVTGTSTFCTLSRDILCSYDTFMNMLCTSTRLAKPTSLYVYAKATYVSKTPPASLPFILLCRRFSTC